MAGCFIPLDALDIQHKALSTAEEKARIQKEAERLKRIGAKMPDAFALNKNPKPPS